MPLVVVTYRSKTIENMTFMNAREAAKNADYLFPSNVWSYGAA
jgi:hypothetical protein